MKRDKEGNTVPVLGTSAEEATHVRRVSPMDTKRAEIYNSPEYRTEVDSGLGPKREAATTKARRSGHARPLGGT